jgi:hypothetical protein
VPGMAWWRNDPARIAAEGRQSGGHSSRFHRAYPQAK